MTTTSNRDDGASARRRQPQSHLGRAERPIRSNPLLKGNGDQKCLIQSVLLSKCPPNGLPEYRRPHQRRRARTGPRR